MAYVPGFANDVFISYGHVDNEKPTLGWVTEFHAFLQGSLRITCSKDVEVWRDPRLDGLGRIADNVRAVAESSAVFVSVLSPGFAQSSWCVQEVQWFLQGQDPRRLLLERRSRIARIVKSPLIDVPWPRGLDDDTLQYLFYEFDEQAEAVGTYFSPAPGSSTYAQFERVANKLGQTIAARLRRLRAEAEKHDARHGAARSIFLAEATKEVRDRGLDQHVADELEDRGFRVVRPSLNADEGAAPNADATRACAEQCDAAVHVLGRFYGSVPYDAEESLVAMQLRIVEEIARNRPDERPLLQLVWLPEGTGEPQPRLKEVIDGLAARKDRAGLDVIAGTEAQFKVALLDLLAPKPVAPPAAVPTQCVFLLCNRKDITDPELQALRAWLHANGYPADLPVYQGDPIELTRFEEERISESDATVIFYGNAEDSWVRQKRTAIQKAWAKVPARRTRLRAVYLSRPEDDLKQAQYKMVPGGRLVEADRFSPLLVLGDCSSFAPQQVTPLTALFAAVEQGS